MIYNTNYHELSMNCCAQHYMNRSALPLATIGTQELHDNYMLNRNHPELLFNRH